MEKAQVWEAARYGSRCMALDKPLTFSEHLETRVTIPTPAELLRLGGHLEQGLGTC